MEILINFCVVIITGISTLIFWEKVIDPKIRKYQEKGGYVDPTK